jgi:gliding motility-associated-like protein
MNGCLSEVGDTQNVFYQPLPTGSPDFFSIAFKDSLVAGDIVINDNPTANGFIIVIVDSTDGGTVENLGNGTVTYRPRSGYFGTDTLVYGICDPLCLNSCDTVTVLIEVTSNFECFIPQGISPNGDGVNDQWMVNCRNSYPNAVMQVFSRWGTLVYQGMPTGWDGTFNGSDLPDGTYFYILKLNDTTFTGTESDPNQGRVGDQYTGYIMLQR